MTERYGVAITGPFAAAAIVAELDDLKARLARLEAERREPAA